MKEMEHPSYEFGGPLSDLSSSSPLNVSRNSEIPPSERHRSSSLLGSWKGFAMTPCSVKMPERGI